MRSHSQYPKEQETELYYTTEESCTEMSHMSEEVRQISE